ncbi:MAG: FAD-containing oxidoreductase [Acidobacteriota bacterium]
MPDTSPTAESGPPTPTVAGRAVKIALGLAVAAGLFALVRWLGPTVAPHVSDFLAWVDSLGFWAPVVFIVGYAVATIAFVPGSLLTMSGGVLFGLVGGTAYVFVGASLGSGLAFLISRYVARGAIEKRLDGNERFALIDKAVGRQGLKIVFLLRLVPFFPFIWLNYGLGLTRVRFLHYLMAGVGMLPGTFLYVYYGKAIGSLAALSQGQSAERGAEQWVFLALGLVAAVAVTTIITRIARRALADATADDRAAEPPAQRSATMHDSKEPMAPDDEHVRELIRHVHPPDWKNPEPAERYHLVVVGAGTAGLVTASIAANLGARVALVERHLMGGDCLNVGCVPSKGVIRAARSWHAARTSAERFHGPSVSGDGDFAGAMERMRRLRAKISPIDGAARFRDMGIDVFLGHGRFVAGDTVEVDGARLRFKKAVIATGGRASAPPIPGLEETPYLTNETVFGLTELPRRFGVIGGGPIGCELAQSFARLGSEVVLVQNGEHLLPKEDVDAARAVEGSLRSDGVDLHLGANVVAVKSAAGGVTLVVEQGSRRSERTVDRLLVAAGRRPNVEDLGLEAAGVEYHRRGIEVDRAMRTSNSRIFAIGDVASALQFTHLADAQARMVVRNAFFFGRGRASDLVVPWCTYTSPEVAHVGMTAAEAAERGPLKVETITLPLDDVDRALLDGETEGFFRVHLAKGSDRILGATLVAEHAGEMLAPVTLAATHGLGLAKFSSTIFPYPTQAEVLRKAGDLYNRQRLTPAVSKFFAAWFRLLG